MDQIQEVPPSKFNQKQSTRLNDSALDANVIQLELLDSCEGEGCRYEEIMGEGLGEVGGGQVGDTGSMGDMGEIWGKLGEEGVLVNREFQVLFRLTCVRTNWQSTVYQIKHGCFSAELKVITLGVRADVLCGQPFASGSFGSVVRLEVDSSNKFALKNIKVNSKSSASVQLALKQVFIAKICSALKVGPKFSRVFTYDALLYEDCLQFAMEVCETSIICQALRQNSEKRNLLRLLKTMHYFHICHLDIKSDNIAWSPTFQKLVFLDFGLSMIVKETPGHKTKTKFRGSFKYCNLQMKKLFFLKMEGYVDLYYNDIHCLQNTCQEIGHPELVPCKSQESNTQYTTIQNQQNSFLKGSSLVRYFKLKYDFFMENFDSAINSAEKETILVKTFKKIIGNSCNQRNIVDFSTAEKLQKISVQLIRSYKWGDEFREIDDLDTLLAHIEEAKQNRFPSVLYRQIVEASDSDRQFAKIWDVDSWKEQIFFFVDVYSNAGENREKLIEKIYRNIASASGPLKQSYTMKFRQVLIYYRDYFAAKKNLVNLERILTYFMLLGDDFNQDRTEEAILRCWEGQGNYGEYLRENFKYFLGNLVSRSQKNLLFYKKNYSDLQRILKKLTKDSVQNTSYINQGMQIQQTMKNIIRTTQKKFSQLSQIRLQDLINKNLKSIISEQAFHYMQMVLQFICEPEMFHKGKCFKFENFYLKMSEFSLKLKSVENNQSTKDYLLKLIKNQSFLRQFISPENIMRQKTNQNKRFQISLYYKDLKSLIFQQNFYENQKYFHMHVYHSDIKDIQQLFYTFFETFERRKPINLKEISNFNINLKQILHIFLIQKYGFNRSISQRSLQRINTKVLNFLEQTQKPQLFEKYKLCDLDRPEDLESSFDDEDRNFYYSQHRILKEMADLLVQKPGNAQQGIFQNFGHHFHLSGKILVICCNYLLSHKLNRNQKLSELILKQHQKLMSRSYQNFYILFPQFLILVLEQYKLKQKFDEVLNCIRAFFQLIFGTTPLFFVNQLLLAIVKFLQGFSKDQLGQILGIGVVGTLKEFWNCIGITFLLYTVERLLENQDKGLDSVRKKRLITICAYFANRFYGPYFQQYKNTIYHETFSLNTKPNKSMKARQTKTGPSKAVS